MFDPKAYWKRRKEGKRGQEYPKPVFYPKGTPVKHLNSKGEEVDYPNGAGQHFNRGIQNRRDYRKRLVNRDGSKPNWNNRNRKSWTERIEATKLRAKDLKDGK